MKSYLIKDTTKEERAELVKKAFYVVSASGDCLPSDEAIKIIKQYIDGEKELEEVQKEIVSRKVSNGK